MSGHSLKNLFSSTTKSLWISRGVLFLWLTVLGWYLFIPPSTPVNIWISFPFLFLLFGYVCLTAFGVGRIAVHRLDVPLSILESNLVAFLLGLGLLSMSIMLVGMLGWLTRTGIFACLTVIGFLASSEWMVIAQNAAVGIRMIRLPHANSVYEKLLFILGIGLFPILIANSLTPVWDYDALLYHMEIPRQFLSQGRIFFNPEVMRSAYPFLGEMLFLVGMIFRLDPLAKLISLAYAILFIFSTYSFACRFFHREVALVAAGILVSNPAFPLWATWAGIDFAWAVYELWAVYAISLWLIAEKTTTGKWLVLAGVMSGLAASTKYISIPALLILAVIILWKTIEGSKRPFAEAFRNLWTFGISAGLIMGTWYIKNWVWTGNPVYPLVFGGLGWDPLKDQILKGYMQTFGVGTSLVDYFLVPYNVYAHQNQFSTAFQEIVHPLIWLAFVFPFLKKTKKYSILFVYGTLYYVWWLLGLQVIRFLLPLSAFFAILAGDVIERLPLLIRNVLKLGLITGLMIFNLVYQTSVLRNSGTFLYLLGRKSSDEFLRLFVDDFSVKQYIQNSLDFDKRVQFLWDGRGYYCDSRCIPDDEQSQAVKLALNSANPESLARELNATGITHLMLNRTDAGWFVRYHDPHEYHKRTLQYFEDTFLPACGKSIYRDAGTELYEITCK